ncbi:unnamed protein product [Polarella glacialis]|uniref:Uncharacterized protein n=1 Tax=Polarella glacialis TaxID=89957 RepID=A0A813K4R7_POLGL|nr:unnamed protein product [Polarella glacialis]
MRAPDSVVVTVPLCGSAASFALTCVLPFCNIASFLWVYTALPLYFLASDRPLWQLSLLLTVVYIPRLLVQLATRNYGEWLCVPMSFIAAACNLLFAIYPDSLAAIWVAVSANCAALNPTAYRALLHDRFAPAGTWQVKRALRVFMFADTLGYACAPFFGGVLYDNGGLRACAIYALAGTAVCALLPLTLASYWSSWRRRGCWTPSCGSNESANKVVESTLSDEPSKATSSKDTQTRPEGEGKDEESVRVAGAPVAVVMIAAFTNITVYAVEWCLYAIYFRLEFGWSGAWCGFAQMVGDLLGAGVLTISTMACVHHSASRCRCGSTPFCETLWRILGAVTRAPLVVPCLALCHGILMLMLAQPDFVVSVLGQILMGTVYVFFEQACQEMILVYSGGSGSLYRHYLAVHYLIFTAGCALGSPIAYGLYGAGGFATAFYVCSGSSIFVGLPTAAYYGCRLASTSGGLLGGFAASEKELSAKGTEGAVRSATV